MGFGAYVGQQRIKQGLKMKIKKDKPNFKLQKIHRQVCTNSTSGVKSMFRDWWLKGQEVNEDHTIIHFLECLGGRIDELQKEWCHRIIILWKNG